MGAGCELSCAAVPRPRAPAAGCPVTELKGGVVPVFFLYAYLAPHTPRNPLLMMCYSTRAVYTICTVIHHCRVYCGPGVLALVAPPLASTMPGRRPL